jgi:hypothetical protein
MTALIAKSVAYKARTANAMVGTLAVRLSSMKKPTISLVNPRLRRLQTTTAVAAAIIGLLRPHLDFDWSDITPITGCTIRPDNGPAIHTREVCPFDNPNDKR